jgi:hypothetical protein
LGMPVPRRVPSQEAAPSRDAGWLAAEGSGAVSDVPKARGDSAALMRGETTVFCPLCVGRPRGDSPASDGPPIPSLDGGHHGKFGRGQQTPPEPWADGERTGEGGSASGDRVPGESLSTFPRNPDPPACILSMRSSPSTQPRDQGPRIGLRRQWELAGSAGQTGIRSHMGKAEGEAL